MTTHHAAVELGVVERWIAPHWKAIAGFACALVGALVTAFPDSPALRTLAAVGTAIGTAIGVYAAPKNVPAGTGTAPDAFGDGAGS